MILVMSTKDNFPANSGAVVQKEQASSEAE